MNTRDYLNGTSTDGYEFFGAHKRKSNDYIFRLLAPNAKEAYIAGDFNNWEKTPMRKYSTGVFSVTIEKAKNLDEYEYEIVDKDGNSYKKLDPYAKRINLDEGTSVIIDDDYKFKYKKSKNEAKNIYQIHLGSMFRSNKDKASIYDQIIKHAKENNYSHVQLMPISEYKNYKQMGYSSIGHFAFSSRYGELKDFKEFVDKLHKEKIGLIVELDIAEFDPDFLYLNIFDGTNLYNYDYDNIKYNYFGSINFDPTKELVRSYLLSAVKYYTKVLNVDGIFFPSAENMIFWQGDRNRGINDDWINFIREVNDLIKANKSFSIGGINGSSDGLDLPFDYIFDSRFKNMIELFKTEPIQRANFQAYVRDLIGNDNGHLIHGFSYVDSFVNEASLAMKMYSNDKKFEQLKTLMTFLYSLKSTKTIFMGDELADFDTFSIYDEFTYEKFDSNQVKFNDFYKDLTKLYMENKALSHVDSAIRTLDIEGYSLYAYERSYKNEKLLVVTNFTDIDYKINAPYDLEELINTDDLKYMGDGNTNGLVKKGEDIRLAPYNSAIFKIK